MTLNQRLASRSKVEAQVAKFLETGLIDYPKRRNFVTEDLGEVSTLSPAIRHRVIDEYTLAQRALAKVGELRSEKFRQEVYWRLYWKGYLEQRPGIWDNWCESLSSFSDETLAKAELVATGNSEVAVMNYFAQQLVDTGYLHNHVRMWFAAFWIHTCKLPWQLGAKFFMSHLLDGDPASNTLSWRWVAGLHTEGKKYLVRRSNLEKYLAPDILALYTDGIDVIADGNALPQGVEFETFKSQQIKEYSNSLKPSSSSNFAIWIHEDDLNFENSPLAELRPKSVFVSYSKTEWTSLSADKKRLDYINAIMADAAERAQSCWPNASIQLNVDDDFSNSLIEWSITNGIKTLVYLQPFVGPAKQALESVAPELSATGVTPIPLRRSNDSQTLPLATAGFFGFWKKLEKQN